MLPGWPSAGKSKLKAKKDQSITAKLIIKFRRVVCKIIDNCYVLRVNLY